MGEQIIMKNWKYPRNKLISLRVNDELYNKVNRILKEKMYFNQNSVADLLEQALIDYINKNQR